MPAIDLAALPGTMTRPLIVAIGHLPILIIALFALPTWWGAAVRPQTHGAAALQLLKELRGWSTDVVSSSASRRSTDAAPAPASRRSAGAVPSSASRWARAK